MKKKLDFSKLKNLKNLKNVDLRQATANIAMQRTRRSEQEFLPAALSILETPPSPVHIIFIWLITSFVLLTLIWCYFGKIDVIAVAQGKIQPAGRVKTIQPVEGGRVISLPVKNGQRVKAGEILVELDPAEANADETASSSALYSFKAEKIRREAAIEIARHDDYKQTPKLTWDESIPKIIQQREERVLNGDIQQLVSTLEGLDAQIEQKLNEKLHSENTISSQEALIDTLQQRVAMRKGLLARGSTTKAAVIDALESLQTQQTSLELQKGKLAETVAALKILQKDRKKAIDAFLAENEQKLNEAERQIDDHSQRSVKAHEKRGHMTLASPIDGTVVGLSVTTKNQVVTVGEELMRIVPANSELEVESYAQNKDIAFIKVGQSAIVKLEAFPFTRFGTIEATVINVGHDAIPEPDAQSVESNPAKSNKSKYFGGAQRTQNLVYPVLLKLSKTTMKVGDDDVPLSAGMAATVEVATGRRRIIDYIISPLVETTSQAMREQ